MTQTGHFQFFDISSDSGSSVSSSDDASVSLAAQRAIETLPRR
jgi:hypothetical protein